MARRHRRSSSAPNVSLFSFMNIMAATIGVQTLMIVISALQIRPGVQAIQLLPAEGAGQGREANYILANGGGELELIGPKQRRDHHHQGLHTNGGGHDVHEREQADAWCC